MFPIKFSFLYNKLQHDNSKTYLENIASQMPVIDIFDDFFSMPHVTVVR